MTALLGALVAVLAAVAVGLAWRRGDGVLRPGSLERIRPAEVALGEGAFGARATLLLFTSPQDAAGPGVRALLEALADGVPGGRVAAVDLAARGDLAGRYAVTRTPTTFVLDGDGRLRARIKGVPTRDVLLAALARTATAASHP